MAGDWNEAEWDGDEYGYYESDKYDAEWQNYEFDHDAAYYESESGVTDPVLDYEFDVAEYDSCYATYLDMRKKFNDLRMARGSLLIVAVDPSANSGATSSQMPSTSKGKGKKGKSKGKGKNLFKTPRPPMKTPDPHGRAQVVLKFHKTPNYTQGSKPTPKSAILGMPSGKLWRVGPSTKIPQALTP